MLQERLCPWGPEYENGEAASRVNSDSHPYLL